MLTSDGMTLEAFTPLWRDAMWNAVDTGERARLVLEMGRAMLRQRGAVTPQMVAFTSDLDPPFSLFELPDVPMADQAPELRETVQKQLSEMGASEIYVMVMLQTGTHEGKPTFLLMSWGETVEGQESCWMLALLKEGEVFQEATLMRAPDPTQTAISRGCRGLLTRFH
ncbi:MAG: hypothetical protein VYE15_02930 [Myxococcota bacterium]|nr:hypothetical protein [Myxococcota bacterium]